MPNIRIAAYSDADQRGVVNVILPIQRQEFGIAITEADQPDLANVNEFYQAGTGGFWVARSNNEIIGTVGLKDIGAGQAALRKMFVAAPFRGREFGVAAKLLDALLAHARTQGVAEIFLGTTDKFLAAHRFWRIAESRSAQNLPGHGRRFEILCDEAVVSVGPNARQRARPCTYKPGALM
jgi:N-acetylglutamate synthase-like GNAT family acetyltransferase